MSGHVTPGTIEDWKREAHRDYANVVAAYAERDAALARATAAEAEAARLMTHAKGQLKRATEQEHRATAAEAREAKLREALAFYSAAWTTHTDWHPFGSTYAPETHTEPSEELWRDAGERARAALAEPARPAAEPPG